MRHNPNSEQPAIALNNLENRLCSHASTGYLVRFVDGPQHVSLSDAHGYDPPIDRRLGPRGRWNRADAVSLPNQIDDYRPTVPLLEVTDGQRSQFAATEPTSEKQCQQSLIPFS